MIINEKKLFWEAVCSRFYTQYVNAQFNFINTDDLILSTFIDTSYHFTSITKELTENEAKDYGHTSAKTLDEKLTSEFGLKVSEIPTKNDKKIKHKFIEEDFEEFFVTASIFSLKRGVSFKVIFIVPNDENKNIEINSIEFPRKYGKIEDKELEELKKELLDNVSHETHMVW